LKHVLAIIGLIIGVVAIGIAAFQDNIRAQITPPAPVQAPPPAQTLKELALEAGKKVVQEKVLKQTPPPPTPPHAPPPKTRDAVELAYVGLGLLAMVIGIVAWIRKDHIRIAGSAVSFGLIAIAWQYVLAGVGIAVAVFILAMFMS